VTIPDHGTYIFSICQKSHYRIPKDSNFKPGNSKIFLVKLKDRCIANGVIYIKGKCAKGSRDVYLGCSNIEGGEYLLFTEIDWRNNIIDE